MTDTHTERGGGGRESDRHTQRGGGGRESDRHTESHKSRVH